MTRLEGNLIGHSHCTSMNESDQLFRASAGDTSALCELLNTNLERLRRMIELRLDRRLAARIDANDVLQEIQLCAFQEIASYPLPLNMPFYVWLRGIAVNKMHELHRHHLGTQKRDATLERSIDRDLRFDLSSNVFAGQLADSGTSPSGTIMREEMKVRLEHAIDQLLYLDKEIIALRHFEQLSPSECGFVLQISDKAASMRYMRALKRLKEVLVNENFDDKLLGF